MQYPMQVTFLICRHTWRHFIKFCSKLNCQLALYLIAKVHIINTKTEPVRFTWCIHVIHTVAVGTSDIIMGNADLSLQLDNEEPISKPSKPRDKRKLFSDGLVGISLLCGVVATLTHGSLCISKFKFDTQIFAWVAIYTNSLSYTIQAQKLQGYSYMVFIEVWRHTCLPELSSQSWKNDIACNKWLICMKMIEWCICTFFYACRSEGPAQVFLIILVWLIAAIGKMSREQRKKVILAYDNMCHVDNLRVARRPLPLPGNLQFLWSDIHKIIDSLHLCNHKDPKCHQLYNPQNIKEENPGYNTMCCESNLCMAESI